MFQEMRIIFNDYKKSRHFSLLMFFCFCERFFTTSFAPIFLIPNSLFKIWWTVVWLKFNSSPIILTVNRRSKFLRLGVFNISSVLNNRGLPQLGSSLIDSVPAENDLKYRITWVLDKTLSLGRWKFCKSFRCTLTKSEAKSDGRPLLEIDVSTHCQNALKKLTPEKNRYGQPNYSNEFKLVVLPPYNIHLPPF